MTRVIVPLFGDYITFTFMHLADTFIQSDLQLHSGYTFLISMCVPWELNPQPFALLTQCSTTEPHRNTLHGPNRDPLTVGNIFVPFLPLNGTHKYPKVQL